MIKHLARGVLGISALFLLTFGNADYASAQLGGTRAQPGAGYCPAGTCGKNGGKRARDVRNCSAANCKR
jgi:hypothetical protein